MANSAEALQEIHVMLATAGTSPIMGNKGSRRP